MAHGLCAGADEDIIRQAIGAQLESATRGGFARLYTERIIQLPISLPVLSAQQAEAYIALAAGQERRTV